MKLIHKTLVLAGLSTLFLTFSPAAGAVSFNFDKIAVVQPGSGEPVSFVGDDLGDDYVKGGIPKSDHTLQVVLGFDAFGPSTLGWHGSAFMYDRTWDDE